MNLKVLHDGAVEIICTGCNGTVSKDHSYCKATTFARADVVQATDEGRFTTKFMTVEFSPTLTAELIKARPMMAGDKINPIHFPQIRQEMAAQVGCGTSDGVVIRHTLVGWHSLGWE